MYCVDLGFQICVLVLGNCFAFELVSFFLFCFFSHVIPYKHNDQISVELVYNDIREYKCRQYSESSQGKCWCDVLGIKLVRTL